MAKTLQIKILKNTIPAGFKKYFSMTKPGGTLDVKGKTAMGLQLINNVLEGSPRESVVPPIRTGFLRGSGSVFVGSKLVGDTRDKGQGKGDPNMSYSANQERVTIGFNAAYAAKLHEMPFSETPAKGHWSPGPGAFSIQSGDVGNKFVEKHLKADKKEIFQLYADIIKKGTGG